MGLFQIFFWQPCNVLDGLMRGNLGGLGPLLAHKSENVTFMGSTECASMIFILRLTTIWLLNTLCIIAASSSLLTSSMRPNVFLGVAEGSAQYKKWYFELVIDQVDHFVTGEPTHLRVGWANTKGYAPYPGGGEGWGGNGVGDDLYSYSFDGLHLWSGRHLISPSYKTCTTGWSYMRVIEIGNLFGYIEVPL